MAKREILYEGVTYPIAYECRGQGAAKTILFLHGWGSSKEALSRAFHGCFEAYQCLFVDLPGFGASPLYHPLDTKTYAAIVQCFLNALEIVPCIIIGHSFGGKVATLLSPPTLILLSSAGIVPLKPLHVRLKIALYKSLKPFAPKGFYRFFASKDVQGMSEVMYATLKKVVNEDFSEVFKAYKGKAYLFWGEEDRATPLSCAKQMAALIPDAHLHVLKGDHFFFLQQGKHIESVLREYGL